MRKRLTWLAAALAVVALLVVPSSARATGTPLRIMTLGDSLTIGHGSADGNGYRTELGAKLTTAGQLYTFTNSGAAHNGWTVQDLRAGIDGWMAADTPDVVLLMVGVNNAAGVSPGMTGFESAYIDLTRRILQLSSTVQVYVAEVPYSVAPWAQNEVDVNIATIHSSWDSYGAAGRVHLVDLSVFPPCLLWDGIHPQNYDPMGRQWYRAMVTAYGLPAIPVDPFRSSARRPGYERSPTDGTC